MIKGNKTKQYSMGIIVVLAMAIGLVVFQTCGRFRTAEWATKVTSDSIPAGDSDSNTESGANSDKLPPADALPPLQAESTSVLGTVTTKTYIYSRPSGVPLHIVISRDSTHTGNLPAVLHIHGGAMMKGEPSENRTVSLAQAGFVGASVEYRLSPGATGELAAIGGFTFPAAIHDCKTAIRFLRAYASEFGIDPSRIGTIGESAGGYLSLMMATTFGDAFLEGSGEYPGISTEVQSAVSFYGPTSYIEMNLEFDNSPNPIASGIENHEKKTSGSYYYLGGLVADNPTLASKASPLSYAVTGKQYPPILMIHGINDPQVIAHQSYLMYDLLKQNGANVELIFMPKRKHSFEQVDAQDPLFDYKFYTWTLIPNLPSYVKTVLPYKYANDFFTDKLK